MSTDNRRFLQIFRRVLLRRAGVHARGDVEPLERGELPHELLKRRVLETLAERRVAPPLHPCRMPFDGFRDRVHALCIRGIPRRLRTPQWLFRQKTRGSCRIPSRLRGGRIPQSPAEQTLRAVRDGAPFRAQRSHEVRARPSPKGELRNPPRMRKANTGKSPLPYVILLRFGPRRRRRSVRLPPQSDRRAPPLPRPRAACPSRRAPRLPCSAR